MSDVDDVDEATPKRPALTISEAARAAGLDRRTIRRYLDAERFGSAYRDPGDGYWRIPVDALLAAGVRLHAPADDGQAPGGQSRGSVTPGAHPPPGGMGIPVDDWRSRALVAEARLEERERLVEALEQALRALQAGPEAPGVGSPVPVPPRPEMSPRSTSQPIVATPTPRRRWWRRGEG